MLEARDSGIGQSDHILFSKARTRSGLIIDVVFVVVEGDGVAVITPLDVKFVEVLIVSIGTNLNYDGLGTGQDVIHILNVEVPQIKMNLVVLKENVTTRCRKSK